MDFASPAAPDEITILARVLGKDEGKLSLTMAKHFLTLAFSDRDTERMHELAVRNQANELSEREREELFRLHKGWDIDLNSQVEISARYLE